MARIGVILLNGQMPRKSSNWLETFLEWSAPRSEATEALLVWSGLFAISSVLKRRVYFPESLMGSYRIYPNLYLLFVGPPGVVRKSTTAGYAEKLLRGVNDLVGSVDKRRIYLGPTAGSASKLIETMTQIPDGAVSVIASEFGNLVMATPEGMYDFFTHVFDNPRDYKYETRMHGVEIVDTPTLNLFGCTTPSWMAENTGYMIGGGFSSRTIFVFEDEARQHRMYYKDVVDMSIIEELGDELVSDLLHIASIKGPFSHENEALLHDMEAWYQDHAAQGSHEVISAFHARKHVHLHKVAMLLSLCERDDRVITRTHFNSAVALLDDIESRLQKGFSVVGRNPYSADLYRILDFIKSAGPIPKRAILQKFWHDLQPDEIAKILEALTTTGAIKASGNQDGYMTYSAT